MIQNHQDKLTWPDGFIGAVYASEGVSDGATLLNAPTGCKIFLSMASHRQFDREPAFDEMRYAEEFFFQQPRIPCTYLDDHDVIFGASEKLEYVFPRLGAKGYGLITVLNSPGAALIGDDLEGFARRSGIPVETVIFEKPDFTRSFGEGFSAAAIRILEVLRPEPLTPVPRRVNLLGVSIWHKHWRESLAELRSLLALSGVEIHTAICAGSSVQELRTLRQACCNVVLHEESGRELASWLETAYGMPWILPETGAPLGFDATERFVEQVCHAAGADPSPAKRRIQSARDMAARKLQDFCLQTGLPKGATFGVCLDASLALPAVTWLHQWLGMIPVAVQAPEEESEAAQRLRRYLEEQGFASAWNGELSSAAPPHALLANHAVVMRVASEQQLHAGVTLALPDEGTIYFVDRCTLGLTGAAWILETLVEGLWTLVESMPGD